MNNEQLDLLIKKADSELLSTFSKHDEIEYFNSNKVIKAFKESKFNIIVLIRFTKWNRPLLTMML